MKHLNWAAILLVGWAFCFQIFMIVAIKRLIEFLSVNTVLSVLGTLLLSTILGSTLMLLIIQNESGE
ncbi:hypothetical protein CBG24_06025 [Limosilactobacillus reuteri]|uniref:DUF2929 family protein n=2 Tax=Limosilactobacillus reuteri TaxID=1598 RepID=A0AB73R1B8_LIMRT|nr:hypothetical protein [Limosilactobacillus reuteri]OYS86612.1 hypothetical protein CBG19_07570 [Limosilactobacillus reuteri]OYS89701.1 hypothetical protein CBG18_07055 [Limosilactobacillus reuteri]OYS93731.1 hypothetical protein CBG10_08090 [Limosilactobacillus reuteri]OYS94490.1 hypothetical protein CBG15_03815 [Limosilactobacillus reuteri]OYS97493.1 hypothetical protein CBG13_03905 [Limosilactobacillus reuteri]